MTQSFDAAAANAAVLEFLEGELAEGIDGDAYRAAVRYSMGRYKRGLPHYLATVRATGLCGQKRAIDIGSGAGHWTLALALENEEAHGLELREEYVEISRRLTDLLRLGGRASFAVGRAEEASYPSGSFDLACCHSVLMYTDHEAVLRRTGHWLQDGGRLYLGYTTTGSRLNALTQGVVKGEWAKVRANVWPLLGQRLYRSGLHRTPNTRTRTFTREELAALAAAVGLGLESEPGGQDGMDKFAGVPATLGLLFRKVGLEPEKRRLSVSAHDESWSAGLTRLVEAGLPATVIEVLESEPGPFDHELADVYARAMVKAGRRGPLLHEIVSGLDGDRYATTRGLVRHERGDFDGALAEYERASGKHPDAEFLQATCLLQLGRYDEADALFLREKQFRGWIGRVAVATESRDLDHAAELVAGFLRERAESGFGAVTGPLLNQLAAAVM